MNKKILRAQMLVSFLLFDTNSFEIVFFFIMKRQDFAI